jgi:hypothetical protein
MEWSAGLQTGCCAGVLARICSELIRACFIYLLSVRARLNRLRKNLIARLFCKKGHDFSRAKYPWGLA